MHGTRTGHTRRIATKSCLEANETSLPSMSSMLPAALRLMCLVGPAMRQRMWIATSAAIAPGHVTGRGGHSTTSEFEDAGVAAAAWENEMIKEARAKEAAMTEEAAAAAAAGEVTHTAKEDKAAAKGDEILQEFKHKAAEEGDTPQHALDLAAARLKSATDELAHDVAAAAAASRRSGSERLTSVHSK